MNSGIINVYKEAGYTSFDVVARLRGILKIKKIGHTGTLDPDAEGVLPVCIGKATKLCDMLTDKDKVYKAVFVLGVTTDTLDLSGSVLAENDVNVTRGQVIDAIDSFVGDIMQVPPMYSALKVNGKKLYELARAGVEVERKARPVTIYSIDIEDISLPEVTICVHCSKGTYIRSLCDDIGRKLGCGAAMKSLLRTKVSQFYIEDALKLSEIENLVAENKFDEVMLPVDQVFMDYPTVYGIPDAEITKLIVNGGKVPINAVFSENVSAFEEGSKVKLYLDDNRFVGVYSLENDLFVLEKMFLE